MKASTILAGMFLVAIACVWIGFYIFVQMPTWVQVGIAIFIFYAFMRNYIWKFKEKIEHKVATWFFKKAFGGMFK